MLTGEQDRYNAAQEPLRALPVHPTRKPRMSVPLSRCAWCGTDPLYQHYHDHEWGQPLHDDRRLFEMLLLEGAQAGLSWITILKRREGYRRVFHDFDPQRVATMADDALAAALQDPGIIRNRLKVASARDNARAFLQLQQQHGSFDRWLWQHVDGRPVVQPAAQFQSLATSPLSDHISRELKQIGMRFVGSTIIYAYLQATGVVNDHTPDCFLSPTQASAGA